MNNGDIITLVNTIRNKSLSGEDFRADEWQSIINFNSKKLFDKKLGFESEYQLNAPIARRGASLSRKISTELKPFLRRSTVPVVGGVATLSSLTIGYLNAIEPSTIYGRGFDELEPDEVAERNGDSVTAPTVYDPAFTWNSDTAVLIYPSTITSIVVSYYTYPTDAVVAFTTNSTTLLKSYNATSSTETGWRDNQLLEIAQMILRDMGVNMERQDIAMYADNLVKTES